MYQVLNDDVINAGRGQKFFGGKKRKGERGDHQENFDEMSV